MNHDFLKIDELCLNENWVEQPLLYMQWAQKLADAKQVLDEANSDLDVIEAESLRDIRKDPTKFKLDAKPTESAIRGIIPLQPAYREARDNVNAARHRVDVVQGAVTALEHRKRALTMLVNLRGQEYFAEPKASRAGSTAMAENSKKQARALGRKIAEEDGE